MVYFGTGCFFALARAVLLPDVKPSCCHPVIWTPAKVKYNSKFWYFLSFLLIVTVFAARNSNKKGRKRRLVEFFYMTDCLPFLSNISCNCLLETKFFPMKIGLPVPLPDCGGLLLPGPGHLLERRIQGVLGHLGVRQRNQGRLRIADKSS